MKINQAIDLGVSAYTKSIKSPTSITLLKSAKENKKLGNGKGTITKGKWKGFPLFSLTLEERKTCPITCHHWSTCFGNNMPFAHRVDALTNTQKFLSILQSEVSELASKYPKGFVVRLHVLGDFFSVDYVNFWVKMIQTYRNLHLFGYTARVFGPIRNALNWLMKSDRVWIRFSSNPKNDGAIYATKATNNVPGIVCPEQTGKTDSCLTCGLCWSINSTILFKEH
jgi:hypothetical protein